MPSEAQAKLAAMQAELVAALTGHAQVPLGFDADRVQAAASALATKRRRAVARVWPALADALRDDFAERFHAYSITQPLPAAGGPLADGRAFVRWLAATQDLPEACRLQALAVDLRYAVTTRGLVLRRWPSFKMALLPRPRRLIVALRFPWLGERWLSIQVGTCA